MIPELNYSSTQIILQWKGFFYTRRYIIFSSVLLFFMTIRSCNSKLSIEHLATGGTRDRQTSILGADQDPLTLLRVQDIITPFPMEISLNICPIKAAKLSQ